MNLSNKAGKRVVIFSLKKKKILVEESYKAIITKTQERFTHASVVFLLLELLMDINSIGVIAGVSGWLSVVISKYIIIFYKENSSRNVILTGKELQ